MINLPVKMKEAIESGSVFTIELYCISLPYTTLYVCSCDENITYNGQTYIAVPIQRGEITKTVDSSVDSCELTVSNTTDHFTQLMFSGINFIGSMVNIYSILYPDSIENPSIVKNVFYGQIDAPELTSDGTFKVQLVSDIPQMRCGRVLQYPCNSTFGDHSCGIKPQSLSGMVVNEKNHRELRLTNYSADNKWKNGIILVEGEGRKIVSQNGSTVVVEYPFLQDILNKNYTIRQGCDKTLSDCDRYNNRRRYAGFPSVPYEYQIKT